MLLENRFNVLSLDSGEEEVDVHPDLTVDPNRKQGGKEEVEWSESS